MSFKAEKGSAETVKVNLPNGTSRTYKPLSLDETKNIAAEAGLVNFDAKDENGRQLKASDFPVNSGEITLSEYNEAKNEYTFTTTG